MKEYLQGCSARTSRKDPVLASTSRGDRLESCKFAADSEQSTVERFLPNLCQMGPQEEHMPIPAPALIVDFFFFVCNMQLSDIYLHY